MTAWFGLRSTEARGAWKAFGTLAGMMLAHAMLETARDALFLSKVSADRLPWAYLAIALLAVAATRANRWLLARVTLRNALTVSLALGALVTLGFFFARKLDPLVLSFALYVWTGLFATVAVVQFWLLQAAALDVNQAKRSFAFIGAGGLVGAVLGSGAAGLLLLRFEPSALLLAAAGVLALTALMPRVMARPVKSPTGRQRTAHAEIRPGRRGGGMKLVSRDRYLKRLFLMGLLATLVVTGVDYVFKSGLSAAVPPERLGETFALFYGAAGIVALLVQLVLAPRLLRSLGVTRALLVLPLLILIGSVGLVGMIGLLPMLLLKGADSALRHSVHRTSTEILYLPLKSAVRERFKGVAEALGQRGGQAIASILILVATACGATLAHAAWALVVLSALWVVSVIGLRPLYVERFRANLRDASLDTNVQVQDLELDSLEALLAALSSDSDAEVTGALEMFADYGKTRLIPALILYHPSSAVVIRAFQLFEAEERADVVRLTQRLLKHEDPQIRAAALRYACRAGAGEDALRKFLDDADPEVRTTAVVELIAAGFSDAPEAVSALTRITTGGSPEMRLALARGLPHLPADRFGWVADELSRLEEKGLSAELARALASAPNVVHLPILVRLLGDRSARESAREALLALGDPALQELARALEDPTTSDHVRRHLPRSISRFESQQSVDILQRALIDERDDRVVYKLLRGLGRLRVSDPTLSVNAGRLLGRARAEVDRAIGLLAAKQLLLRACWGAATDQGSAVELLVALLSDAHLRAIERSFRVMHCVYPQHELGIVFRAATSDDGRLRADSRELLDNVLPVDFRGALQALLDDRDEGARLQAALGHSPVALGRLLAELGEEPDAEHAQALVTRLLQELGDDRSDSIRRVADYCASQLGLEPVSVRQPTSDKRAGAFDDLLQGAARLVGGEVSPYAS